MTELTPCYDRINCGFILITLPLQTNRNVKTVPTQLSSRLGPGIGASRRQPTSLNKVDTSGGSYAVSLDKIVTEYLRKQHAVCRNPVQTCPPFSLFV